MRTQKSVQRKLRLPGASSISSKNNIEVLDALVLRQLVNEKLKPISILVGTKEYKIPKNEIKQCLEAFLEALDLKSAQRDGNLLTTQEAANLLGVSRPYVIKLIENNQLKSFTVGTHRRILEGDALALRKKMRNEQNEALEALAVETESLGLEFK